MMTETERITHMHTDATAAAEYWLANFKPVTYETPFYIDGDWVRVTIELVSPADVFRADVQIERRLEQFSYE